MAHTRQEWAKVRAEYRKGKGSLRELARKHGIPVSTVLKRAAAEGWASERERVGIESQARAVARDTDSLAAMLSRHKAAANLGIALAVARLQQIAEVAAKTPDVVSEAEVDGLTKVVARMVPVERLAAGIDRIKPVKPVEMADDDEIAFDVDLPSEAEEAAPPAAPMKP